MLTNVGSDDDVPPKKEGLFTAQTYLSLSPTNTHTHIRGCSRHVFPCRSSTRYQRGIPSLLNCEGSLESTYGLHYFCCLSMLTTLPVLLISLS
ncbi:hypothetical protein BDV30DRAFT_215828 [Aspergillus minisclerotigenes]|uniref:Uncharacterized protein n=1 Tax=Aspergillus minisclerotigenes TaxID=656917 RepID=A0A5N6IUM2_9EURO|nr:hypothetical protein BDV30DRAFT_215828 [Aspergillus minisclerotigenes]